MHAVARKTAILNGFCSVDGKIPVQMAQVAASALVKAVDAADTCLTRAFTFRSVQLPAGVIRPVVLVSGAVAPIGSGSCSGRLGVSADFQRDV